MTSLGDMMRQHLRARLDRRREAHAEAASRVLHKLSEVVPALAVEYGVSRVIVFGSLVQGGWHPDRSDVDLWLGGQPTDPFGFAGRLMGLLGYDVHVVPAEGAPESLRLRVAREGRQVYPEAGP
jgi:predicted nucleotidyltransferase